MDEELEQERWEDDGGHIYARPPGEIIFRF